MQVKENERGVYWFFPTASGPDLQRSAEEMAQIAGMLAFYGTWDIYKEIWPALMSLQEKARAAREKFGGIRG